MANYTTNYPALPALASGAPDSPAAPIVAGTPLDDADMALVTRQAKRRRILFEANPRRATNQELQDAVKRELCVHLENATGAAAMPLWAIAIQNQLTDLQNQMSNAATHAPNHHIFPRRNAAGVLPTAAAGIGFFPNDRLGLDSLTAAQCGQLLQFYGMPLNPQATRLERLKIFLGIRP